MKYLKSINEKLEVEKLTEEQFLNLVNTKCHKFLEYGKIGKYDEDSLIFRKENDIGDYALIDPKSAPHERIAPYAGKNYHNLLISNLDSWKGWPRRNKSLICASSRRALTHYGPTTIYVLIPFDTTKIATGSESDFWYCFKNLPSSTKDGMGDITRKNASISVWMEKLMNELDPGTKDDYDEKNLNWSELKSFLEKTKPSDAVKKKFFTTADGRYMYRSFFSLLSNLNRFLDPNVNKFKLGDSLDTMGIYSNLSEDHANESWMEDPVLLIKYAYDAEYKKYTGKSPMNNYPWTKFLEEKLYHK